MRFFHRLWMAPAAVLMLAGLGAAQQIPAEQQTRMIPVRVHVVLSEYDGTKQISSLPYTLAVNAVGGPESRASGVARMDETHLRMGVRVPIVTGPNRVFQYMNVGTNIDCWAVEREGGVYQLGVSIERNTVYEPGNGMLLPNVANSGIPATLNFSISDTLLLHDGQTDDSTVASDPASGHQLRVSVSLHVEKSE